MTCHVPTACCLVAAAILAAPVRAQDAAPPKAVTVLPVFYVPKGQDEPTDAQAELLVKHVEWARGRYKELLHGETFGVAAGKPRVYQSPRDLDFLRKLPDRGLPTVTAEVLTHLKFTRFNCPHVLLVVVVNPANEFPVGSAQPLNGGLSTGGGVVQVCTFAMDRMPNFQSTLQHELGHAFGLPHVDVYKYDMKANPSLMSYNPKHHTKGLTPSETPGELIPEDVRALALNRRVFPALRFDPANDVPTGYAIADRIVPLGPMKLPDHPDGPKFTTASGEDFGTKVANLRAGPVGPNKKGKVTFDAGTMWQSAKAAGGWVTVDVALPYETELTAVGVHSQHSGEYNAARAVRVSIAKEKGQSRKIAQVSLKSADEKVAIPKTKAKEWRFEFQAGESQAVTLRGLRFYAGADELFPPLVPSTP
ncbi:hypothetical protein [Limnoglobus roseus]|uniref:F5/8 type C domain-containing protein n=1 Tax=Limnoglobus roseus TaxID=2598579 RepID=A0A5C1A8E0_9BACT|nr:hypothetical protein [Limnoglobus roseus]QEL15589.1 hypothetical protein PX52LOC_02518 [Limnoglobus roseus]